MRSFWKLNKVAIWSVVGFSLTLFLFSLPLLVLAQCWSDYPNVTGSPQAVGGVVAADIVARECTADAATCQAKKNGWIYPDKGGLGCTSGVCCIQLKSLGGCYPDYTEADRQNVQATTCVKTDTLCASPKKILGTGFGCALVDGKNQTCCATMKAGAAGGKTGGAALPETGSTAEWQYQNKEKTGIVLVSCTKDGNCTIADIVQQGINFAKWLMGLAGALFLIVFVYGGAMYLASFGNSAWVTKGKTALTRGAIGIVLVMGAWTVIAYVAASLGYNAASMSGATGTDEACTKKAGYSCMEVTPEQETGAKATYMCESKLCMSQPKNLKYKCCIAAPHN